MEKPKFITDGIVKLAKFFNEQIPAEEREKFKAYFAKFDATPKTVTTADGKTISYMEPLTANTTAVTMVGADGVAAPAPDGTYLIPDCCSITVTGGIATAITPATPTPAPAPAPMAEQKATLESHAAKFAMGTDSDRITNLEAMVKALMQYCFSYEIRDALGENAAEIFTATFGEHNKKTIEDATVKLSAENKALKAEIAELKDGSKILFSTLDKILSAPVENIIETEGKQKSWEEMTPLERYRESKKS